MSAAGLAVAGATRVPAVAMPATTRLRPAAVPCSGSVITAGQDGTFAEEGTP